MNKFKNQVKSVVMAKSFMFKLGELKTDNDKQARKLESKIETTTVQTKPPNKKAKRGMKIHEPSVSDDNSPNKTKNSKPVSVSQISKGQNQSNEDFFDIEGDEEEGIVNPFLMITGKNNSEDTEKLKKEIMDKIDSFEKKCNEKMDMFDTKLFAANKTFMSRVEGLSGEIKQIGPDIFAKIEVMDKTFKEMKKDNEIFKVNTKIDVQELQR